VALQRSLHPRPGRCRRALPRSRRDVRIHIRARLVNAMSSSPASPVRSWQEAEAVSAVWVRWLGHPDAARTPPGADGGVDVVSSTALAQVKWKSKAVDRPTVQQLLGADAGSGRTLLFFSRSGYTQQAVTYADTVGIQCFTIAGTGRISPVNAAAAAAYQASHQYHRENGGWTDPALTAAMQKQVLEWAGGILVAIGFATWFWWEDLGGAGPWLIAPAAAAAVVAVAALWVLYAVVHDIPSKTSPPRQTPSAARPALSAPPTSPAASRTAPPARLPVRPPAPPQGVAQATPTSPARPARPVSSNGSAGRDVAASGEAAAALVSLDRDRLVDLVAGAKQRMARSGGALTGRWAGARTTRTRTPRPRDTVWADPDGAVTAWLGRVSDDRPLTGWVRDGEGAWFYTDLTAWYADVVAAGLRQQHAGPAAPWRPQPQPKPPKQAERACASPASSARSSTTSSSLASPRTPWSARNGCGSSWRSTPAPPSATGRTARRTPSTRAIRRPSWACCVNTRPSVASACGRSGSRPTQNAKAEPDLSVVDAVPGSLDLPALVARIDASSLHTMRVSVLGLQTHGCLPRRVRAL
jgi:hypothetical protein